MADNFNLAKFLRNNQLLNESISGYKDIEPMKEEDQETDGFEDAASGLMVYWGKKPSGDKAILVKKHGKDLSPDEQEKLPAKEFDTLSMLKRKAWLLGNKKKASEPISGMNEGSDDIDYADYGVDPMDPDADTIVSFMQDMRDINNMKDPSFIDNFKTWLKGLKSDYQFNKRFKDSPFKMNEAEEERAYFDYKNNRRSFLPSPDEFQGALDSSEMSKHDFMMGLADEGFDKDVSAIVSKTIEGLIKGGFGAQDIVDFLATDFSLDEEVSGVQMETRMISYDSDKQIDGKLYDVDLGFKSFRAVYDADNEEFIFQYPDKGGVKSISKYDDNIKRVELHNPIKSPFSDPGYKNRD